ncbi:MAG: acyl-CoA dehydrogenase [Deltaproteobacteria bacterium]|jgi:alkylation response protein AidB-like acyl-CoA dehydrogenase|nr:MAG: acyl-CoA dehydrogenase [Deltaproteobacteria bacterium]
MIQLTEEQKMIRDMVRKIAKEKIAPRAAEIDETDEFPMDYVEVYKENNLFKMVLPEKHGGIDANTTTLCVIVEELAKAYASAPQMLITTGAALHILLKAATEAQQMRFFKRLEQGTQACSFALTEPNHGSDAGSLQTKAVLDGDHYIINGSKAFITTGEIAEMHLVFVRTGGEKTKGISVIMVDKNTPGFRVGKKEHKMGFAGTGTVELIFEDAKVHKDNIVGKVNEGWSLLLNIANMMRVWGAGCTALGNAQGALDYVVEYAKQRFQFGKPIAGFQAVQFMLADMAILIESARSLIYRTAYVMDTDGESFKNIETLVCMSKCYAADVGMKVTTDAVQIMGGYGYTKEYPVERRMRDAKSVQIYDGSNQIQRVVVSRNLLG